MSVFESITIGEGWISEHFFTSSGSGSFETKVKERLKEWDEAEVAGQTSPRSRFTKARRDLLAELAALEEAESSESGGNAHAQELLLTTLGYVDGSGLKVAAEGPLLRVSAPGVEAQVPLAIVLASPVETADDLLAKDEPTLVEPVKLDEDGDEFTSVARLLSALFTGDDPPSFALVLAGRITLLAEKGRWAEGRYLAINLQLVAERNDTRKGGEIDTALTCLEARSLVPDAEGGTWWDRMLAESVKHTVGVSKDLRDGVRLSIELIAQEVVDRRKEKGLDPLPADQAQPLARQALRFLYRILFLLYAEASPELEVLPVGAPEYDQGYSLDRLRELVQVKLATPQAKAGTHLYDSLALLFRLVDQGHTAHGENDLAFNSLRADLFKPEATALIDEMSLGNEALQRVLTHLLLSKEQRGKDRGFISYAELGINQLGAVYEGLMSYTGFFAETDLYEVAKSGDNSKGSWVVPHDRIDGISEDDFVRQPDPVTGELKPVLHKRGSFVFRLAGRERQQSASYYTPEVLTRFTVRQALDELLGPEGSRPPEGTAAATLWDEAQQRGRLSASELLDLTICEPALGSGAFAIEATRQLAERYLRRRQEELGERIDPDAYPHELQKAKAYIALHNVYGVDLNATAVELAEISLWLDTMVSGLAAPWFGLHLRRGNSLIGARRAVYSPTQVQKGIWLKEVARDLPLSSLAADAEAGFIDSDLGDGVHHFLLPADGWGAAADAKEAKDLAPEVVKALKAWRSGIRRKPTTKQTVALQSLARRVETLWQFALQRLRIAEDQSRRAIDVWGLPTRHSGPDIRPSGLDPESPGHYVTREEIEATLADANGALSRLRRVMNAWCALWFWPLTDGLRTVSTENGELLVNPPTLDQWIAGLQLVIGSAGNKAAWQADTLMPKLDWTELGDAEVSDLEWATAQSIDRAKQAQPWLEVCERIANQQGFFHWELEFATVFAQGGFDVQVGNPPWVRPRSDVEALLAEADPWWQLKSKSTAQEDKIHREKALAVAGMPDLILDGTTDVAALAALVGAPPEYPLLAGLQPDFYRCFMEQTWRHAKPTSSVGLIHPETHFTDEKAGLLRRAAYRRLRRHWQFINELQLFQEVDHHVSFGVHTYGGESQPSFLQASSLYHPDTVEASLKHDGSGTEPGLKDEDGHWDLRPHAGRIQSVDRGILAA
ncbi:MAG: class I SAM-dependent DNA methyltransferase, partial [Propionibacteriaceae bacterium]|nr:class I SAM-dependent DNA methyltransferase [Propionibacteriaceae bacterium]